MCEDSNIFREIDKKHTTAVVVEGVEEVVKASVEGSLIVKLGKGWSQEQHWKHFNVDTNLQSLNHLVLRYSGAVSQR
jgi:hypothetical protein